MVDLEAPGAILLVHGGELADVRELLDELGLGFAESSPRTTDLQDYRDASVVLATPQYLANRLQAGEPGRAIRIAIIEESARTLRAMLIRGGVDWLVRRPFHPAALRLLLLHCIYQGPEKRKFRRVSIGAAIHFQTGWRKRGALLAEISPRDCRILSSKPVGVGRRLKLRLPGELAGRRVLHLDGRVVRTSPPEDGDGSHEICVLFDPLRPKETQRLKDLVAAHAQGPAVLRGTAARHLERNRPEDPAEQVRVRRSVITFGDDVSAEESEAVESVESAALPAGEERRTDPRHAFRRRVIALSQEATRVLMGRDISPHGMRVDPSPNLEVGKELQIAIHVAGHEAPLVVDVRVDRDGGEQGVVLQFVELTPTGAGFLEDMLGELPALAGSVECGGEKAFVVSEIVE